jgi:hypothetical protein
VRYSTSTFGAEIVRPVLKYSGLEWLGIPRHNVVQCCAMLRYGGVTSMVEVAKGKTLDPPDSETA